MLGLVLIFVGALLIPCNGHTATNPNNFSKLPIEISDFSLFEQFLINNIDSIAEQSPIRAAEIFFQNSQDPTPIGPLSLGETLVLNQNNPGVIFTNIVIHNQFAGSATLTWQPSASLTSLFLQSFLYQNDWAFFTPDFLRNRYPYFFKPQAKVEHFTMIWHDLSSLLKVKSELAIVTNLQKIVRHIQFLNNDIETLKIYGALTRFSISKNDKSIFILNLKYQFSEQIFCEQNLRTDLNPHSKDIQHLQTHFNCQGFKVLGLNKQRLAH